MKIRTKCKKVDYIGNCSECGTEYELSKKGESYQRDSLLRL